MKSIKVEIKNENEAKLAAAIMAAVGIGHEYKRTAEDNLQYMKGTLEAFGGGWRYVLIEGNHLNACSGAHSSSTLVDIGGLAVYAAGLLDQIAVGEHVAEFKMGGGVRGVQVGCTFVEAATVKRIHDRLFPKEAK